MKTRIATVKAGGDKALFSYPVSGDDLRKIGVMLLHNDFTADFRGDVGGELKKCYRIAKKYGGWKLLKWNGAEKRYADVAWMKSEYMICEFLWLLEGKEV